MRRILSFLMVMLLGGGSFFVPGMASAAEPSNDEELTVSTIPSWPGMTVRVDGKPYVTGADGSVTVSAQGVAEFLRVGNLSSRVSADSMQAVQGSAPVRISPSGIRKSNGGVLITVDVAWLVEFTYSGTGANEVDKDKLGLLGIRGTGEVEQVDPHEPLWLQGSRVVPRVGGLENKKLYWTVQEVLYQGANVVNASQQDLSS